jgi:hypothetical protein
MIPHYVLFINRMGDYMTGFNRSKLSHEATPTVMEYGRKPGGSNA